MESLVASVSTLKTQLISVVSPYIYQNMNNLFVAIEKHTELTKDKGSIELFQEELKRFVNWSSERVAQETKRLVEQTRCSYLDKLLMRILSDEARILAFGKSIALDYPSLNDYTHRVYIELAKLLYSNPHLFYNKGLSSFHAHKNYTCVMTLIDKAMNSALRYFLPLEDILDYTLDVEDDNEAGYNNLEDAYENYQHSVDSNIESNEEESIVDLDDEVVDEDEEEDDHVEEVDTTEAPVEESQYEEDAKEEVRSVDDVAEAKGGNNEQPLQEEGFRFW